MSADLAARIRARIERDGPIPVADFVDAALYDPLDGFYASGGHAGRRGDFLTAPEVGPLFGAVITNAIDSWWRAAGEPSRFVVAEHGAGPGTLARTVTLAAGACLAAGALEWVMVERSGAQRRSHPEGPHLRSLASADELGPADVVLANELLDNLPFEIAARRADGWVERLVASSADGFVLVDGPSVDSPVGADEFAVGVELPIASQATAWIAAQRAASSAAQVVVFDYAAPIETLAQRNGGWLRSYRQHRRIEDWLAAPGTCDITIDLPIEQIGADADRIETQAAFLRRYGVDALVDEGRRLWEEQASVGDLAALRARSRISEAEALLDPDGMGAFTVWRWGVDPAVD